MKTLSKILALLSVFLALPVLAQQATVTATLPSTAWAGGSVVATFQSQGGGLPPAQNRTQSGIIDSTGTFTLANVWNNTNAAYLPSQTVFNICVGNAPSTTCYSATVAINSSSQNISTAFAGAPTPGGGGIVTPTGVGAQFLAVGDSHPQGFGTSLPSIEGYLPQVGAGRGWITSNAAVGGYYLLDIWAEYNWNRPIGPSTITLIDASTNDAIAMSEQQGGAASSFTTAHGTLLASMQGAWIAWAGITDAYRILDTEATNVGAWQALNNVAPGYPSFFLYTNGAGDTQTYTFTGTRADLILFVSQDVAGTYTVKVDGVSVVCPFPANTTTGGGGVDYSGQVAGRGQAGIIDVPITGLTNTSHTVVLTNVGSIATVGLTYSTPTSPKPLVIAAYLPHSAGNGNLTDALVTDSRTYLTPMYTSFLNDGFNLVTVDYTVAPTSVPAGQPTANYWWNTADSTQNFDNLHPNKLGYQHIANRILSQLVGK